MNKNLLYSISAILLLTMIISGTTYAFLSSSVKGQNNSIEYNSNNLNIIYQKGEPISGTMNVVSTKEAGKSTTINMRLAETSAKGAKINLLLNITNITENLSINGFMWQVDVYENGTLTRTNTNNFLNKHNNDVITLIEDYELTTTNATFTVYLWVDGNNSTNNVMNGSFDGYISAKSDNFSAILS